MTLMMNDHDLITLNAYIDNELNAEERTAFERYLAQNQHLKGELQSIQRTKYLLLQVERVKAPRNFTLDPAIYGKERKTWLSAFIPANVMQPLAAGASLLLALIFFAAGMLTLTGGIPFAPSNVAMESQADRAEDEALLMEPAPEEPMLAMEAPAPQEEGEMGAASEAEQGMDMDDTTATEEGRGGGNLPPSDAGGMPAPLPTSISMADGDTTNGIETREMEPETAITGSYAGEERPISEKDDADTVTVDWMLIFSLILFLGAAVFFGFAIILMIRKRQTR